MEKSNSGLTLVGQLNFYKGLALELAVAMILVCSEGYRIRAIRQKFNSEEIDILCEKGIGRSLQVLVCECKNVQKLIEHEDVDKLVERVGKVKSHFYWKMAARIEGRFYTTSNFDEKAERLASSVKKFTIKLVNGDRLRKIFAENGLKFP